MSLFCSTNKKVYSTNYAMLAGYLLHPQYLIISYCPNGLTYKINSIIIFILSRKCKFTTTKTRYTSYKLVHQHCLMQWLQILSHFNSSLHKNIIVENDPLQTAMSLLKAEQRRPRRGVTPTSQILDLQNASRSWRGVSSFFASVVLSKDEAAKAEGQDRKEFGQAASERSIRR